MKKSKKKNPRKLYFQGMWLTVRKNFEHTPEIESAEDIYTKLENEISNKTIKRLAKA